MKKYFAIMWEAGDTLAKLFLISSFIEKRLNKTFSFKPYRVTEIQLPKCHPVTIYDDTVRYGGCHEMCAYEVKV